MTLLSLVSTSPRQTCAVIYAVVPVSHFIYVGLQFIYVGHTSFSYFTLIFLLSLLDDDDEELANEDVDVLEVDDEVMEEED